MKSTQAFFIFLMLFPVLIFAQEKQLRNSRAINATSIARNSAIQNDIPGKRFFEERRFQYAWHPQSRQKSANVILQRLDSTSWQGNYLDKRAWGNYYKEYFIYNNSGQNLQYTEYDWDPDLEAWYPYVDDTYEYDASGDMVIQIESYFDEPSGTWEPGYKYEYSYNSSHLPVQQLQYDWDYGSSEWYLGYKQEFQYDGSGKIILAHQYVWDNSLSQWISVAKIDYAYNSNGLVDEVICYYWEESMGDWLVYYKDEYIYDANNRLITFTESNWDVMGSTWVGSYKDEYTYDIQDNVDIAYEYFWDDYGHQWIPQFREDYSHDNTYPFSSLLLPFVAGGETLMYFGHMLTGIDESEWDEASSSWLESMKGTFFYSSQDITSTNEPMPLQGLVNPNPASDYFTVTLPNGCTEAIIQLYDIQGQKILESKITENYKIDVRSCKPGIYFYKLRVNGKAETGKLVKK